jgi:hypothetical protein
MKNNVFRSVEFWKSAIMTLPDNSFFELLRSVFGKIKTPFNKQMLLSDLEAFLSREDIQKNAACYIGHDDAQVIAAVAALNEPVSGELESFFSGELNYVELHDIITNLEERFILYRFQEKGLNRLALNPVLEPVLAPFAGAADLLFPSVPADGGGMATNEMETAGAVSAPAPFNDLMLAALLSFVSGWEPFFRNEGEIRKRIIGAGNKVFPGLDLEPVLGGLRALGLFRAEEDRLVPDYRHFSGFGELSPAERVEYCAAGIYCFLVSKPPADISFYLLRAQIRDIAAFMRQFLGSLEPERLYPAQTLKRLSGVLERDRDGAETGYERINGACLLECLEKTGLLVPAAPGYRCLGSPAAKAADSGGVAAGPVIAMDTPFSCLVYPEIGYADGISLAAMFAVREAGVSLRFEMTRDSAVRAFDRGFSADMMIELLTRLSAGRIDENLIWTLRDWEKRYGAVSLHRGIVLSLSPERRYLAEAESLARLIRETLAPGIYLLPESAEAEASAALQKSGVDIIARRGADGGRAGDPRASNVSSGGTRDAFPPLHFTGSRGFACPQSSAAGKTYRPAAHQASARQASTLIEGFHSILEQMRGYGGAARFSKAELDELAARIDRRLVLCESQLRDASVRYEKLEARGLDYPGKAMIAKQAIASRSPVEVVRTGKKGERIFGILRALEKEEGESVLVIDPQGGGETGGEYLRIPLGKISLLRRIKKSIFENNS